MVAKSVLIVDDAMLMRMKMRMLMEKLDYEVVGEAANGVQAVEKFAALRPDIVFMDITMPEMDGLTALKEIKKIDATATVIMVTALGQDRFVKEAIISGARNFIIKPFQDAKVEEVLAKL